MDLHMGNVGASLHEGDGPCRRAMKMRSEMSLRNLAVGTLVACSLIVVAGCAPKESLEPTKSTSTTPAVVEEPAKIAEIAPPVVEEPAKIAETAPPVVEEPGLPVVAAKGRLKVFILAGQSNMEGAGRIEMDGSRNDGKGTVEYMVKRSAEKDRYKHMIDGDGDWVVRDDVWIWYFDRKGKLTAGYGSGKGGNIGPEFAFGHAMGEHLEDQVLLIKTAWGGKSLQGDFRPPSSGGKVGPYYTEMLKHVKDVLANLKTHFPDYDGKGYEIAGFGWHQGWNDGCVLAAVKEYKQNMINFIKDVRKDLGVLDLPFVIADSGFGGPNQKVQRRLLIKKAQADAAAHYGAEGNAALVETTTFWRTRDVSPGGHGYHWNESGESYLLIGDGMAEEMIKLLAGR